VRTGGECSPACFDHRHRRELRPEPPSDRTHCPPACSPCSLRADAAQRAGTTRHPAATSRPHPTRNPRRLSRPRRMRTAMHARSWGQLCGSRRTPHVVGRGTRAQTQTEHQQVEGGVKERAASSPQQAALSPLLSVKTSACGHKTDTSETTRATPGDASPRPQPIRFAGKTVSQVIALVRRGSTVRVRQRALCFCLLSR
jgi:hypothetical protein